MIKLHFVTRLLLVQLIGVLTLNVATANPEQLQQLVDAKTQAITVILNDSEMDRPQKDAKIVDIADEMADFDLMGALSLGREGWGQLSEEEREEFIFLFVENIKDSYLEKIYLYNGETVRTGTANQTSPTRIEVPSYLRTDDGEVEIVYKFYLGEQDAWSIYDININGVSIVATNRSQFGEFLENHTAQDLIEQLRQAETR